MKARSPSRVRESGGKSSFSSYNGNCVEIADSGAEAVRVRDSKAGLYGPVLQFSRTDWASFLAGIKGNES